MFREVDAGAPTRTCAKQSADKGPRGLRLHAEVWNAAIAVIARTRWSRIGLVLSACIIGVSLAILWRRLHHLDIHHVMTALEKKPPHEIVLAALAIAASYATLTFYDWFALRTIGARHVPYRVAALASFTGYSICHNIRETLLPRAPE